MAAKKQKKKKKHRFFWFTVKLQLFFILLVLGSLGYYYLGGYAKEVEALHTEAVALVAASDESMFVPARKSQVYDCNGALISEKSGEKDAQYVTYQDIPASFVQTIISIEDKKYYKHHGVDIKGVLRAAKAMVVNGKVTQGGSTISMQLAKLMFMESSNKTWQYKVEQMFIAVELEKRYSKNQIMEYYLNNIYFANGYYGIYAACHGYFDCELSELDTSYVAFLLAIPNSPTFYDPLSNVAHTMDRRNRILTNLWEDGKLSNEAYYAAVAEDVLLNQPQAKGNLWNNYVDTFVYHRATLGMMEDQGFVFQYDFDSKEEEKAYDEEYDELYASCQKTLYTGGYKIYTSIDMAKQELLQEAVDQGLSSFTEVSEEGVYTMQGAAVCIDNESGYVVAIVGGRSQDYATYTLNRAYQSHRQPGSSIKPLIVYTPSFERGYDPDTIMDDHEFEGGPKNAGDVYYGEVPIRMAVAKSMNTVAWQLYEELTPTVGLQYLKNMNFTNIFESDYVLPTGIGGFTTGVSALEMAAGYAAIENDGKYRNPTCIRWIVDSNENIVYVSDREEKQIYQETAARMMTDVMKSVITEGTGVEFALDNDMICAGKTGTTNDYKDGWFVGYTRYYTTSVWVGYDIPKTVDTLSKSKYPGKIWQQYMNEIHENLEPLEFLPYAQLSEEYLESQAPGEEEKNPEEEPSDLEEEAEGEEDAGIEETPDAGEEDVDTNAQGGDNAPGAEANGQGEIVSPEDEVGENDLPVAPESDANQVPIVEE